MIALTNKLEIPLPLSPHGEIRQTKAQQPRQEDASSSRGNDARGGRGGRGGRGARGGRGGRLQGGYL